jgi:hypothetical protein
MIVFLAGERHHPAQVSSLPTLSSSSVSAFVASFSAPDTRLQKAIGTADDAFAHHCS